MSSGNDDLDMQNAKIRLEPVTIDNWKACIALELTPEQEEFVPSNLYSIAEAQFYTDARSNAIYNENSQLVGYALFGRDVIADKWKIFRIMVDKFHQRKGYGESAMRVIIEQISKEPGGNEILINYQDNNQAARMLYAKLGFVEQNANKESQITAIMKLALDRFQGSAPGCKKWG